jgi:hypothetical protein
MIEQAFSLFTERTQPCVDVFQGTSDDELARLSLGITSLLHEASFFENAYVFRERRLA